MVLFKNFTVDGTDYLYDTGTNAIVALPHGVCLWLDDLVPGGVSEFPSDDNPERRAAATFVARARDRNGLFSSCSRRNYRGILDRNGLTTRLTHGMHGLLLGVTDKCNQRCSYCIYSGNYGGRRTHGTSRMSWDVAKRSIDFFLEHRADSPPLFITFYGGEPLLAWSLVQRCVKYVRGLGISGLTFLLNTNLSLLDKGKASFLAENSIALAVSLDGPASIHDAARRFPSGKPTHARVVRWLTYIRERFPAYWDKNVMLHATFDRSSGIEPVFDFFCDKAWRNLPITIEGIRQEGQAKHRADRVSKVPLQEGLDRLIMQHVSSLETGEPFAHLLFTNIFRHVWKDLPARKIGYPPTETHPMRTCVPGLARLYVDPDGIFYPCEKTDVPAARIGNIELGIDLGRIYRLLLRQVRFCEANCEKCWAWRLCSLCLAHFIQGGEIRWSAARRRCKAERERIHRSLERFTYIYAHEPRSTWKHPFSLHRAVAEAEQARKKAAPPRYDPLEKSGLAVLYR